MIFRKLYRYANLQFVDIRAIAWIIFWFLHLNDVVTERNGHDIIRSVDYQSCYEATEVKLFKKKIFYIFFIVLLYLKTTCRRGIAPTLNGIDHSVIRGLVTTGQWFRRGPSLSRVEHHYCVKQCGIIDWSRICPLPQVSVLLLHHVVFFYLIVIRFFLV